VTVPASGSPPSWTLLAVDGDPCILAALQRVIRAMGWRIVTTGRAEDALAMLATRSIDAVLSGLRMPEGEGLDLLERVSRGWPDTARVLLTGQPDPALLIDAINHGRLHGCIVKPWKDDELMSMLRRIAQRQRLDAAGHAVEPRGSAVPLGPQRITTAGRSDACGAATVDVCAGRVSITSLTQYAQTLCLRTSDLRTGQTLAQDFVSPEGALLLSAGHRLSEDLIHRIQVFERKHHLSLTLVVQTAPEDRR
jgi:CheY-like chemotaxis protein